MPTFRDTGQVADGIYLIDIRIWGIEKQMAVYVIVGPDKTALIDTGTKREFKTILAELQRLGINKLDYIIATHSHIDHAGAIYDFAKYFPHATIGLPALAQELKAEYAKKSEKMGLSNPSCFLKEGSLIKLDSNYVLDVLETPGHIADHLTILNKKLGILFVGDACGSHHLGAGFSRPTAYAPYFDHHTYIQSLLRFQKLNPKGLAIASYGFASSADAQNGITTAITDYHTWIQTVTDAMRKNPDEEYIAEVLLHKFGRSPGELQENRPDQWVKSILLGIARGFIHSLSLTKT